MTLSKNLNGVYSLYPNTPIYNTLQRQSCLNTLSISRQFRVNSVSTARQYRGNTEAIPSQQQNILRTPSIGTALENSSPVGVRLGVRLSNGTRCGEPDLTPKAQQVLERLAQVFESVRLPHDVGVQRYAHYQGLGTTWVIGLREHDVELVLDHQGKVLHVQLSVDHHGDVVELLRIGDGPKRSLALGLDAGGLIVMAIIQGVLKTQLGQ